MYSPRYIDNIGKSVSPKRSFWQRLFGYKPTYESPPAPPPENQDPPKEQEPGQ